MMLGSNNNNARQATSIQTNAESSLDHGTIISQSTTASSSSKMQGPRRVSNVYLKQEDSDKNKIIETPKLLKTEATKPADFHAMNASMDSIESQARLDYRPPSIYAGSRSPRNNMDSHALPPLEYMRNPKDGSLILDHKSIPISVDRYLATKPLKQDLSSRPGPGGCKLTYLSGECVTSTLNEVFGFDGWNLDIVKTQREECVKDDKGRFHIAYTAQVRLTHKRSGAYKEDVGAGDAIDKNLGNAVANALKSSITDAMKRAARHFGNKLGNSLYHDKFNIRNAPSTMKVALEEHDQKLKSQFGIDASIPATVSSTNPVGAGHQVVKLESCTLQQDPVLASDRMMMHQGEVSKASPYAQTAVNTMQTLRQTSGSTQNRGQNSICPAHVGSNAAHGSTTSSGNVAIAQNMTKPSANAKMPNMITAQRQSSNGFYNSNSVSPLDRTSTNLNKQYNGSNSDANVYRPIIPTSAPLPPSSTQYDDHLLSSIFGENKENDFSSSGMGSMSRPSTSNGRKPSDVSVTSTKRPGASNIDPTVTKKASVNPYANN